MIRRTQAQRRDETRRLLLTAAARVFAESGFHATAVSDVVRTAGCSTGALYDHFESKAALFLALLDEAIPAWASGYTAAVSREDTLEGRLGAAAHRWSELLDGAPQVFLLFVEFWCVAVRDPTLRPRFAERYAEIRHAMSDLLDAGAEELDLDLPLPAPALASAVTALADGLALQRMADPAAVPNDLLERVLRQLFAVRGRRTGGDTIPR
jgi:AcrR family transcriptional regulator